MMIVKDSSKLMQFKAEADRVGLRHGLQDRNYYVHIVPINDEEKIVAFEGDLKLLISSKEVVDITNMNRYNTQTLTQGGGRYKAVKHFIGSMNELF
jgi:hypothetical protein